MNTPLMSPSRQGSILVLVVGLAALLLSMAVAVLSSQQAMDASTPLALKEAQNRMTLSGALFFIQEHSRIGWGSSPGEYSFGWTDIRDGSAGPRGPANASGVIANQYTAGTFPALGTVFRGDLHTWALPPFAVSQNTMPNPYQLDPADTEMSVWNPITSHPLTKVVDGSAGKKNTRMPMVIDIWSRSYDYIKNNDRAGARFHQPVADTWSDFKAGDLTHDRSSMGRAWFRIYREDTADHDGNGDPWYDTVAYGGHGTFIVTVGAGATRGYRFWDNTTDFVNGRTALPSDVAGYSSSLEPETASSSGLFSSEAVFKRLRQNERIAWYRVHWVANTSTGYDAMLLRATGRGRDMQNNYHGLITRLDTNTDNHILYHQGGSIRMIQRLEKEPPKW